MIKYIIKKIINVIKTLDDSQDPFENGDLIEEREYIEYVKSPVRKPRAKPIITGKHGKQKGEKVAEWRRRIIKRYNELKHVKYNPESKYYTTAKINDFIKEIETIEGAGKASEKSIIKHYIKSHDIAL